MAQGKAGRTARARRGGERGARASRAERGRAKTEGSKPERARTIDPGRIDALLVDLDGVVTKTATVHAAAWKRAFDEVLRERAERLGEPFRPFDVATDYPRHVDGRPREEGVRAFLAARGLSLPEGAPDDPPERASVGGLGRRKNAYFREHLKAHGVEVYASSVAFLRRAKARGLKLAIISSSRNCAALLEAAGLGELFDVRVDGTVRERLDLQGKPAPDMFLEAARRLGVRAQRAVVIEDALPGVEAGRRGGFALVVGVDRADQADALAEHGADLVVRDLGELRLGRGKPARRADKPNALASLDRIGRALRGKRVVVFLDYDGTLTPIVERPELATLSPGTRATLEALARECAVAVVSGRSRADVTKLVGLTNLFYAGSHGFDIAGPDGREIRHEAGQSFIPVIDQAEAELRRRLAGVKGALVEGKRYAIAVHYRLVDEAEAPQVEAAVDEVVGRHRKLRKTGGKKVYELRPRLDWDKGKAVLWLLDALELGGPDVVPIYLGDDVTDEDAFAALKGRGIGICVGEDAVATLADYRLRNPAEVRDFLDSLAAVLRKRRR